MLGLAALLAAGLFTVWVSLVAWTAWTLTHPARRSYAWAVARSLPGDPGEVRLPATDSGPAVEGLDFQVLRIEPRRLAAWDIRAGNASGPVVIVHHGWGDSRVVMLSRVNAMWRAASRIMLFDSRGHGETPGVCSLGMREVDDLLAVVRHVRATDRRGEDTPIVLYGFSLGAGVCIVAAGNDGRIGHVVAEAPYRVPRTPARNVLASRGLPHRFTLGPALALLGLRFAGDWTWAFATGAAAFDRRVHASRLLTGTRLTILHGTEDGICPIEDARAIAASAPDARLIEIEGGTHTGLWTDATTAEWVISHVRACLESAAPGEGANTGTIDA